MTQEDKELLIKDLCARLPYGVKALVCIEDEVSNTFASFPDTITKIDVANGIINDEYSIEDIKPYLFPMASITEEQCNELFEYSKNRFCSESDVIDWFNAHHFDYRRLIDKGLAIDATNLNIY